MTRIIAGAAGSLTIDVPKSGTRPTSDRVREAVFSSLSAWDALAGRRVLDLYAGSGALGLESASRGATEVTLVERHAPAAQVAKQNASRVSAAIAKGARGAAAPRITVEKAAVQAYLAAAVGHWDVVFCDPPYELDEAALAEDLRLLAPHLAPEAVLLVERSGRSPEPAWPAGISCFREKRYGETVLWWAEPSTPDPAAADPSVESLPA